MEFRSFTHLEAAEHVPIRVELAGLANRVFAFLIDQVLMLTFMGLVMLFFALPPFNRELSGLSRTVVPVTLLVIFFGYQMLQEWRMNGQSVGKLLFHIRVVRNNGQPIGFWEAFGRNILRVVDVYLSGIGLVAMMFSRDEKRLGDYLAGTLVINDQPLSRPAPEAAGLSSQPSSAAVLMTPEEAELVRGFLARRAGMPAENRRELARGLSAYLSERLHRPLVDEADLEILLAEYAGNG